MSSTAWGTQRYARNAARYAKVWTALKPSGATAFGSACHVAVHALVLCKASVYFSASARFVGGLIWMFHEVTVFVRQIAAVSDVRAMRYTIVVGCTA